MSAPAASYACSRAIENGYGASPEQAAHAVSRAAEAGAVGGSIEDWDPSAGLYDPVHAAERVAAAVEAARGFGFPFMLTARAENYMRDNLDLEDTRARDDELGLRLHARTP
jgi:2-methylisocitrate lyase-like PEP mutase family enzyme